MGLDPAHKLCWGFIWASAAPREGPLCMVFGGVVQDGGHGGMVALAASLFGV